MKIRGNAYIQSRCSNISAILFFKIFYLLIFRQRGREKERKRNINVWLLLARPLLGTSPETQACALTGN